MLDPPPPNPLAHTHIPPPQPQTPSTGLQLSFKEEGAGKRYSECAPTPPPKMVKEKVSCLQLTFRFDSRFSSLVADSKLICCWWFCCKFVDFLLVVFAVIRKFVFVMIFLDRFCWFDLFILDSFLSFAFIWVDYFYLFIVRFLFLVSISVHYVMEWQSLSYIHWVYASRWWQWPLRGLGAEGGISFFFLFYLKSFFSHISHLRLMLRLSR